MQQENAHHLKLNILVEGDIEGLNKESTKNDFRILYSEGNIASIECDYASLISLIEKGIIHHSELISGKKQILNDKVRQSKS